MKLFSDLFTEHHFAHFVSIEYWKPQGIEFCTGLVYTWIWEPHIRKIKCHFCF